MSAAPVLCEMPRRLTFVVLGRPVAWSRAGTFGSRRFTPARMRDYQKAVRYAAIEAMPEAWPLDNAAGYRVRVAAYLETRRRVDLDNIAKGITDSLQATKRAPGVAYDDDSRIVELHALKLYDRDDPRVLVEVEAL